MKRAIMLKKLIMYVIEPTTEVVSPFAKVMNMKPDIKATTFVTSSQIIIT